MKENRSIKLKSPERKALMKYVSQGVHPVRLVRRANVLLGIGAKSGSRMSDNEIAEKYGVSRQTVQNVKRDYLESGVEKIMQRKKRLTPPIPAKADGMFEAHLIALCCMEPPAGYARWSVRLLADKCVELGYIDSISHMTVNRTLKKMNLSLT
jgi:DNA-binding CsgD family transcriptional regulator